MKRILSAVFLLLFLCAAVHAASVTVMSPVHTDNWKIGTNHNIRWRTSGVTSGKYQIYLIRRNGTSLVTVGTIAYNIPYNRTSYNWNAGYLRNGTKVATGDQYMVQVRLMGTSTFDFSNAYFSLYEDPVSTLTLISPDGGESWHKNSVNTITWTSTGLTSSDTLKLSLFEGSVNIGVIADSIAYNSNSFSWTTGSLVSGSVTEYSSDYKVRIEQNGSTVKDDSNSCFTITEPVNNHVPDAPVITKPTAGTIYSLNPLFEWTYSDQDGNSQKRFEIQIFQGANLLYTILKDGTAGQAQSYILESTYTLSYDTQYIYKIRVSDENTGSGWSTQSTLTFTIEEPVVPAPKRVIAKRKADGSVYIGWRMLYEKEGNANKYENCSYNIYRKRSNETSFTLLNANPVVNSTNYLDNDPNNTGFVCSYKVTALDSNGAESVFSTEVKAATSNSGSDFLYIQKNGFNTVSNKVGVARTGDINGDGLPDVLVVSRNNSAPYYFYVHVFKNMGDGTVQEACNFNLGEFTNGGFQPRLVPMTFWDMDGDGKDELIGFFKEGTGTSVNLYLKVKNAETGADIASKLLTGCVTKSYFYKTLTIAKLDGINPAIICNSERDFGHGWVSAYILNNNQLFSVWSTEKKYLNKQMPAYGGTTIIHPSHQFEVADIDEDGKDEVFFGVYVFDETGFMNGNGAVNGLWGGKTYPHIDGVHIGDIDPTRPGQEVYMHQEWIQPGGVFLFDKNGNEIWHRDYSGTWAAHAHIGWIANVTDHSAGMEAFTIHKQENKSEQMNYETLMSASGVLLAQTVQGDRNRMIVDDPIDWDGDNVKELFSPVGFLYSIIRNAHGVYFLGDWAYYSADPDDQSLFLNSQTIKFVKDIVGDYREEVIVFNSVNLTMRIYTNTKVNTEKKKSPCESRQYLLKKTWSGH